MRSNCYSLLHDPSLHSNTLKKFYLIRDKTLFSIPHAPKLNDTLFSKYTAIYLDLKSYTNTHQIDSKFYSI